MRKRERDKDRKGVYILYMILPMICDRYSTFSPWNFTSH